jgi:hypothetical protein
LESTPSRLGRLPLATRRSLALVLGLATIGYFSLLARTFFQLTSPGSVLPDAMLISSLLLESKKPVSHIERLLDSTDGEMNRGGTMRPAFTEQSIGWESLIERLTADEKAALLAAREGERLALLDWVRSGANREAYEQDNYRLNESSGVRQITAGYVADGDAHGDQAAARVRIHTLINDRCVTCHGENGRHGTAQFIPLDSYEHLQPHLILDKPNERRVWLIVALGGLIPVSLFGSLLFCFTAQPVSTRIAVVVMTLAALIVLVAAWAISRPGTLGIYAVLGSALVASIGVLIEMTAGLSELWGARPAESNATPPVNPQYSVAANSKEAPGDF